MQVWTTQVSHDITTIYFSMNGLCEKTWRRLVVLTERVSANTNTPQLVFMSKVPQLLRLDRIGGETHTHTRTKTTQRLNCILPNRPRTWRERSDAKPARLIHRETQTGLPALPSGLRVLSGNQSHAQLLHDHTIFPTSYHRFIGQYGTVFITKACSHSV